MVETKTTSFVKVTKFNVSEIFYYNEQSQQQIYFQILDK